MPQKAELQMAETEPWYSSRSVETPYHNNTLCSDGASIEDRVFGTDGRHLCRQCAYFNDRDEI